MTVPFSFLPDIFLAVSVIAASGWLALFFFPRRLWANLWFAGVIVPLILSLFYVYLMLTFWFLPPQGEVSGFFSLNGSNELFENDGLQLAAWTDILLLSLIAGAWMARKAMQVRMPYVYLLPCLLLMLAAPGFGFILFCVVASFGSRWSAIASVENIAPSDSAPVSAVPTGSEAMVR